MSKLRRIQFFSAAFAMVMASAFAFAGFPLWLDSPTRSNLNDPKLGGGPTAVPTSTPNAVPAAPGAPTFTGVTSSSITLNWGAVSTASSYKIYGCSGGGCTPTLQNAGVTGTTYTYNSLSSGTSYTYYIVANNVQGDSAVGTSATQSTTASTSTNTFTSSNTPTNTNTAVGTATNTNTFTNTFTNTDTFTSTNTPTATNTVAGATNTDTFTFTNTPTATDTVAGATDTDTPTNTPTATNTSGGPTDTPTPTVACTAPARVGDPYGNYQMNNTGGICRDASGNVYVSDVNNDRILKYDSTGNYLASYGVSGSGNGEFNTPWSLAMDGSGNFYVLDQGNHRVQKFDSSWSYLGQFGVADDGSAGNYMMSQGRGLAVDGAGNIYVSDYFMYRVQVYDSSFSYVRTIGTGSYGYDGNQWCYYSGDQICQSCIDAGLPLDPIAPPPQPADSCDGDNGYNGCSGFYGCAIQFGDPAEGVFAGPGGVAYSARNETFPTGAASVFGGPHTTTAGIIYVVDTGNNRIQAFDAATGDFITQWGHGNDSPGTFYYATGITVDQYTGEVYVGEYNRVEVFDALGHFLREAPGSVAALSAAGSADGSVSSPAGLITDSTTSSAATQIYLADTYNSRVQQWNVGSGNSWPSPFIRKWNTTAGGGSDNTRFYDPVGLATSSLASGAGCGETFVMDVGNKVVKKFDSCGNFMMKFDETTVAAGTSAQPAGNWNGINAIGTDPVDGSVYVVDAGNSRVVKYNGTTGAYILQFDGSLGSAGLMGWWWQDGSDNNKWKVHMGGIAVDPATQNVWVSDSSHNIIQIFDKNGNFIDFFGGTGNGAGLFDNPSGIAIAGGSAYICDTGNRLIQKFDVVPISPTVYNETAEWGGPVPPASLPPTPPTAAALPPPLDYMNGPTSVAVDSLGNVYVSDTGWNRVIQTDSSGLSPVLKAGNVNGWSGGAANEFRSPYGIAIDCSGNVLVVDCYNDRVVKLP